MKISILKQELLDAFEKGYLAGAGVDKFGELAHPRQVTAHKHALSYATLRTEVLTPEDTEI